MKFWSFGALLLALLGCGKRIPLPESTEAIPVPAAAADSDEGAELILTGFESGQICRLIVHRQWFENDEKSQANYRVEVSTSYSHEGSGIGRQVLSFSPTEANVLLWENKASGEYLKLTVFNTEAPLADPDFFTLRWMHRKHHHKNTCKDLRAR